MTVDEIREIRETIRENRVFVSFCVAMTLGFFAFMLTWKGCIEPMREVAALAEVEVAQ